MKPYKYNYSEEEGIYDLCNFMQDEIRLYAKDFLYSMNDGYYYLKDGETFKLNKEQHTEIQLRNNYKVGGVLL